MPRILSGASTGRSARVGVAVSRFNEEITERLLSGALQTLRDQGVADADVEVVRVPGAFELPMACHWLAETRRFTALVMLGAVVRGDTDHYDYVCSGVTEGAMRVGLDHGVPIGFGVLTCASWEQALARAGGTEGNKGSDAVLAALAMADLRRQLGAG